MQQQIMMIPFDSFEDMRIGVYDGAHGEPISPPLEKGDPKKGWYILYISFQQSPAFEQSEDEDDEDDEPIATTDRAVVMLWGRPKAGAVATPAVTEESKKEPEPAPEPEAEPEKKEE